MKKVYIERLKLFKNIPMILLNNITEIDEGFIDDNFEIFQDECDECEGQGEIDGKTCDECDGNGYFDSEPYQYYIVDVNELDIERLKDFGVDLAYSNKLERYILPIYDFGTSWNAFSYSKEVDDDYELWLDETLTRKTVY